jgi:hypothetical protein
MTYRNGTYIAFHAEGTTDPTESDIKYYNLIKAWTQKGDDDFSMINSHEKTSAVRDSSKKETLRSRLVTRLRNSKHLLLIIGPTTQNDTDWVPFEISYAIDECKIPVIAVYPGYDYIQNPAALAHLWPLALKSRINNAKAKVIHIPFKKEPLKDAISQFDIHSPPQGSLVYYTTATYKQWGIM